MYKCEDCGHIFEEPKKYYEDRTPCCAFEGGTFIEEFLGCPLCEGAYREYEEEEQEEEDGYTDGDTEEVETT